jgi:hypothetical protein
MLDQEGSHVQWRVGHRIGEKSTARGAVDFSFDCGQ